MLRGPDAVHPRASRTRPNAAAVPSHAAVDERPVDVARLEYAPYAAAVPSMLAARTAVQSARAAAARPRLWPTALVELARFAPDGWWRRPPFLPLPRPGLTRFRSETMYGDPDDGASAGDLVVWLEWCHAQNRRGQPARRSG